MLNFGFGANDISRAVKANVDVDFWLNQLNSAAHYMAGYEQEAVQRIYWLLNLAIKAECAGNHDLAIGALGNALHTVQDFWAHAYQGVTNFEHIKKGSSPDDPSQHVFEYQQAYIKSVELLNEFFVRVSMLKQ